MQALIAHSTATWKQTITVTHIDRSEPDPSLFAVSDRYKFAEPAVYRPGNGVSAPQVTYSVDPRYTDEARRAKFHGMCVVALIVDRNGVPQNVHVVQPLRKDLDEAALEAVRQYRFKPAMYDGHPVAVEVKIQVNFRIY